MAKTKIMVTAKKIQEYIQLEDIHPSGVCGSAVWISSVLHTMCARLCHNKCSGLRFLNEITDFPSLCVEVQRGGCRVADDLSG